MLKKVEKYILSLSQLSRTRIDQLAAKNQTVLWRQFPDNKSLFF